MTTPRTTALAYGLALETSTATGSVALGRGERILATAALTRARVHAREFLPLIDELCCAQGVGPGSIEEVYVSAGPGSFTGLRIGITAAKMLSLASGARIVAVPTLEVIAQNVADADPRPSRVVVILDAKRGHVYAAPFEWNGHGFAPLAAPVEADPLTMLSSQRADCAVLGEGVLYHREAVATSGRRVVHESLFPPRAQTVYRLGFARAQKGEFTDRRALIPTYIRPPEAEEVWQRRQAAR